MQTERIARAFIVIGVTWAASTTTAGTGMDGVGALPLRGIIAASAFLFARSVRRGKPFAPPVIAASVYGVLAFLTGVIGIGKAASPRSSIGFLHLGNDASVGASNAFPEMYWARYAPSPGPSQGFALFVAIMVVVVCAVATLRVRSAVRSSDET
jgi:hypothetical protein